MRLLACILLAVVAGCGRRSGARSTSAPTSVTLITAEDIERAPGLSLEQLLVTRVPGLSLTRAKDGHTVIHIRGTTSLLSEQEPLFVVNGIPLDTPAGGNFFALNPRDIEYIQVLRDAASTALYGSRGGNGVIVIRTKQS